MIAAGLDPVDCHGMPSALILGLDHSDHPESDQQNYSTNMNPKTAQETTEKPGKGFKMNSRFDRDMPCPREPVSVVLKA